MGYYVDGQGDIVIPTDKLDEAYAAVVALNTRNELKRGGHWPPTNAKPADSTSNGDPNTWFSWMDWNYDETCDSLEEVMRLLGFDTDMQEDGLHILEYHDKTGNEDHFLDAISPFVVDGSEFYWRGEDESIWRNRYQGGKYATFRRMPRSTLNQFTDEWKA